MDQKDLGTVIAAAAVGTMEIIAQHGLSNPFIRHAVERDAHAISNLLKELNEA